MKKEKSIVEGQKIASDFEDSIFGKSISFACNTGIEVSDPNIEEPLYDEPPEERSIELLEPSKLVSLRELFAAFLFVFVLVFFCAMLMCGGSLP